MLIGLVGKPSAGKSTFFKALTLSDVAIANYPFTTIKPNHGVGYVKIECVDKEFGVQCNPREGFCTHGWRFVPVELLDVAGLVPGASEGKGMGNQFLDDLRQADCLIHIVDASGSLNEKGEPVDIGSYDPANDIRFLENELDLWYYQIFQKVWRKFSYQTNQEKANVIKAITKQFTGLGVNEDMVKKILAKLKLTDKIIIEWSEDEVKTLATELRKATKPMIIAANKVDVPGAYEKYLKLKGDFPGYTIIPCSAESELALKEAARHELIEYIPGGKSFTVLHPEKLSEKQAKALGFLKSMLDKFGSTGVQDTVNAAVFDVLRYIAIFPGGVNKLTDSKGNVLPDCFLLPGGSTAVDFAYKLHTTMGDNFIRATDVRTKMSLRRDSPLKHRDIVELFFNK